MIRKNLPVVLLLAVLSAVTFSCRKSSVATTDVSRLYFPLQYGKYVVYNVDSVRYYGLAGTKYEVKCQMKYEVTDTVTINKQLSYLLNVYWRPYDGADWVGSSVIILTPTANSLLWSQDQAQYIQLMFPVANGTTWKGNANVTTQDSIFSYLNNWDYTYYNYHKSYFNGYVNFDNTVTLVEANQNVNYQNVDSAVSGYRTFVEQVYAFNVGMIYKQWTHYTFGAPDTGQNKNGFSVTMAAVNYN